MKKAHERTNPVTRPLIGTALCMAVIALVACIWAAQGTVHPQFGRVYRSSMDQDGFARRAAEYVDNHSPIRTRILNYVHGRKTPQRLSLGTNTLCVAVQNPITKTAWLALHVPPSTNGFWELAPCGRTNLLEVRAQDLNTTFVRLGDRLGGATFGDDWASTAVRVREREIVFARQVGQAGPVYVIWFTRVSAMKYEIQYAVVQTQTAQPHHSADASQPFGLHAIREQLAAGSHR